MLDEKANSAEIWTTMRAIGIRAKDAASLLATADTAQKDAALQAAATALRERRNAISAANALDMNALHMNAAASDRLTDAFIDRLKLTPDRIEAMASGLEAVAAQSDPVGAEIAAWEQPNGLKIRRVRTPIGVIGVIYESRPNVTADAGALALKSGNAAILRGGSESFHSASAIHACLAEGLAAAGLPPAAIQLTPTRDRAAVGHMLADMADYIDVIIPRGGRRLVERVQTTARVPVFAHLEGICHIYIHANADPTMAKDVVLNAKMRRAGICGAAECVLVDQAALAATAPGVVAALLEAGCEVRGDAAIQFLDPRVKPAGADDFGKEFLDAIIAMKVVPNLEAATDHIKRFGSHHTEAIISQDADAATTFFRRVDSAILMWNASTQFADGSEFGMGAEIGIATGKLHARGPVGAEELTSFKYLVTGDGAIRS